MIEILPMEFNTTLDTLITAIRPTIKIEKWHVFSGEINGHLVRIKYFRKYLQIFDVDGIRYGGMDYKTNAEFIAYINSLLNK